MKLFRIWLKIYYLALYPYPTEPQIVDFGHFPLFVWNWVCQKKKCTFFSFFSLDFLDLKGNFQTFEFLAMTANLNSLKSKETFFFVQTLSVQFIDKFVEFLHGIPCYDNQLFFIGNLKSSIHWQNNFWIPWNQRKLFFYRKLWVFNSLTNSFTNKFSIPWYDSELFFSCKLSVFNSLTIPLKNKFWIPWNFQFFIQFLGKQSKLFFQSKLSIFNSLIIFHGFSHNSLKQKQTGIPWSQSKREFLAIKGKFFFIGNFEFSIHWQKNQGNFQFFIEFLAIKGNFFFTAKLKSSIHWQIRGIPWYFQFFIEFLCSRHKEDPWNRSKVFLFSKVQVFNSLTKNKGKPWKFFLPWKKGNSLFIEQRKSPAKFHQNGVKFPQNEGWFLFCLGFPSIKKRWPSKRKKKHLLCFLQKKRNCFLQKNLKKVHQRCLCTHREIWTRHLYGKKSFRSFRVCQFRHMRKCVWSPFWKEKLWKKRICRAISIDTSSSCMKRVEFKCVWKGSLCVWKKNQAKSRVELLFKVLQTFVLPLDYFAALEKKS